VALQGSSPTAGALIVDSTDYLKYLNKHNKHSGLSNLTQSNINNDKLAFERIIKKISLISKNQK
jgi:hypothetical protein